MFDLQSDWIKSFRKQPDVFKSCEKVKKMFYIVKDVNDNDLVLSYELYPKTGYIELDYLNKNFKINSGHAYGFALGIMLALKNWNVDFKQFGFSDVIIEYVNSIYDNDHSFWTYDVEPVGTKVALNSSKNTNFFDEIVLSGPFDGNELNLTVNEAVKLFPVLMTLANVDQHLSSIFFEKEANIFEQQLFIAQSFSWLTI